MDIEDKWEKNCPYVDKCDFGGWMENIMQLGGIKWEEEANMGITGEQNTTMGIDWEYNTIMGMNREQMVLMGYRMQLQG